MQWQDHFLKGKQIVLASCSKDCQPNANIVLSLGIVDGKLLIANCQMSTTIKNLKENPRICVVGGYYRIRGSVEIFDSGEYFDLCKKENDGYEVKNAILIDIEEVFDLDKVKVIGN